MSAETIQRSSETPPQEPGPSPSSLSRDDVFELLSNQRRRLTLHHLKQREEEVDLGTLSERVAAWENGQSLAEVSSAQRKRVYTSLQQFHLPKMDDQEVIEFDRRAGTVELSRRAEDLDIYLEVVEGHDIPWSQYYLGLSALNLALIVASLVNAYPISLLPTASWAVFAVTTVLISALVHTYVSKSEMQLGRTGGPPEVE